MDHAIERAEQEARQYARTVEVQYLEACTVFHLAEDGFGVDGREVYSEMRRSDLPPDDYLDRFFFTGSENSADGPVATSRTTRPSESA